MTNGSRPPIVHGSYRSPRRPQHTDVTYARGTAFGERIAHGKLTMSIGMVLALRLGQNPYLPKHVIAMSGIDRLRFTAPVKRGDTIHAINRVAALGVKDTTRGVPQYESEIVNQDEDSVVRWSSRMLVARRPAG